MAGHGVAVMFGGTAGEGIESAGEAFARSLAACGFRPTTQRDFPSRIRGGDTTFTVRLTPEGFLAPPAFVDLAVAFNASVLPRMRLRLGEGSLLLVDAAVTADLDEAASVGIEPFPLTDLAEAAGDKRAKNVVALGAAAALLDLPLDELGEQVAARFAHKGEAVVATNHAALRAGFDEARSRFGAAPAFRSPRPDGGPAWFLSGNEAACLGALAAGCRLVAGYPITPASDVLEYLTPRLAELGGQALQMEDEMAALNVCLGAGFAGARALTATSGPGLSLMTETIGLAGTAEVPVVILDCQRPGPSTGMPTKHGQEDLWHMVHGGHGEFPRVVLAPMDVEDAFHATSEAFRLSQAFRCPAFVALDQQCSLFKQVTPPLNMAVEARRQPVRSPASDDVGLDAWAGTYQPYGGDGSEVSSRVALPGEPGGLHYSNSTEHGPAGFTNEDPKVRDAMVERRLRRLATIAKEAKDPIVVWEPKGEPVAVVVSWGSTVGACREAQARLEAEGVPVRFVAVRLVWPFPPALKDALGDLPVVVAEANGFGQFARLLRSELPVHDRLVEALRYDGTPVRSDDVVAAVHEALAASASAAGTEVLA